MENDSKPLATIPDFTPVPREKDRSNGWKPEVQRAFIEALAETGSVRAACRRVGRADHGVYRLRRHPEAEEFRRAWQAALDIGIQRIEDVAMDRAINGTEEPVYSYGKLVGTRIKYNDALLMFMLRNRAPGRFAGGGAARGLSASDKPRLARLKKQWREEWEREEFGDERETLDSIDRFIDGMRSNRLANMGPRTRAAWEEYQRIEQEENADYGSWLHEDEPADEADSAPPQLPAPDGDAAGAQKEPGELGHARAHILKMVEERAQQLRETEASPAPESATEPEPSPAPPTGPRIITF